MGDYVINARQAANGDWYIGGIGDWTARDFSLALTFLGAGNYKYDLWQDGFNADRNANDFKKTKGKITSSEKLNIHFAPGGGFAMRIYK